MSSFAIFLLCVQVCLVQNVYSQCLRGAALPPPALGCGAGLGASLPYGLGAELVSPVSGYLTSAAYGGAGVGTVLVGGELPVAGSTLVNGQVPVLGSVCFDGAVPAAGSVSIAGSCGFGCNSY